ncbi:parathymosin [Neophocaena asiaeorientalis asiaeorientalis]|uniref:Parathymosin n=1 Tax=Neophocaena asiaeorientalis asiaeorientalis TaxID=1706337 RepID=A0A341AIE2_NEOAA|nr:parathymosin [Neophocaena asiaeorientalis asiaeorientalis]
MTRTQERSWRWRYGFESHQRLRTKGGRPFLLSQPLPRPPRERRCRRRGEIQRDVEVAPALFLLFKLLVSLIPGRPFHLLPPHPTPWQKSRGYWWGVCRIQAIPPARPQKTHPTLAGSRSGFGEDLKEKKEKVEEKASRKERKKEVVEEEENGAEEEEETAEDGEEEDEGDEEDEEEEEDEDEGPALKRAAEEEDEADPKRQKTENGASA